MRYDDKGEILIICQVHFKIYEKQIGSKKTAYISKNDSTLIDITDNNKKAYRVVIFNHGLLPNILKHWDYRQEFSTI